jgi:molybdopterin molybdotransferase
MLAKPALLAMQGLPSDYGRATIKAQLSRKVSSTLGRAEIVRVKLHEKGGKFFAEPIAISGSSILSTMTNADGFIVVPEDVEGFDKGLEVEVELYR